MALVQVAAWEADKAAAPTPNLIARHSMNPKTVSGMPLSQRLYLPLSTARLGASQTQSEKRNPTHGYDVNNEIGLGGGCHWCTEAVFQTLRGVQQVDQGFICSSPPDDTWSEAAIVRFDPKVIGLPSLIDIHLHTHASTSQHSMRAKYRSAIYVSSTRQAYEAIAILNDMQYAFSEPLVTRVLPVAGFRSSEPTWRGYFEKNGGNQFCERYIEPKLEKLRNAYTHLVIGSKSAQARHVLTGATGDVRHRENPSKP